MRATFLALLFPLAVVAQEAPAPETSGDPWPAIRAERVATLLPDAMDRADVDAWLVLCRENDNDPMARHVGCENAGGEAAFLFFRTASGVEPFAVSPAGEAASLAELGQQEVIEIPRGESVWSSVVSLFQRFAPEAIAINRGGSPISDGLSSTQYERMQAGLDDWMDRTASAETLISEWLSVKTPEEVDFMRRAANLTALWQELAYAAAVPGVTTDRNIADFLEAKMREAGVDDGWAPDQNPAVNSGRDRGHSHPTDRVIQPGDFIQTDFGIRVGDMWVTDIQRFAYVLAPGETEAPPEAVAKWEAAKRGRQAAFEAMRPGARGVDVDRAQRAEMRASGSLPVMWSTGHPVGYWAHDSGPSLGGGQEGRTPSGAQLKTLRPGMTFAFDGFHSWPLANGETKTISVEEMVVITEDGAEWLVPPQEDLILIRSRD
ncbi:M24 family metallopeptidase [Rubricoccus marinus]|uniref:Peptidase M24 n=1 Tax=Rubricoccus marinus TaxID=716817 RepID=A0A259TVU8_9BACT|nr:M24 family metallopeptidase [Rubricoccus marinus]OZC01889.1 peptidase M24 [Rubricoccus marinus]